MHMSMEVNEREGSDGADFKFDIIIMMISLSYTIAATI